MVRVRLTKHEEETALARAICELADAVEAQGVQLDGCGVRTARNLIAMFDAGLLPDPYAPPAPPTAERHWDPLPPFDAHADRRRA